MPDGQTPSDAKAAPAALLRLRLFGSFEAVLNGEPLRLRGRKSQALLACLAIASRTGETRGRLASLLWSESDDDRARATLRQSLSELKSVLAQAGYSGLQAERDSIALSDVQTDLRAVQDMLGFQEIHPALREKPRLAASLLEGFDDIDPAFRIWLMGLRRALERSWTRSLEAILAQASTDAQKADVASVLLRLDPTHEAACRRLMQSAHAEGDTAGALRAYETLWDALAAEHDMEPSGQTQALVAEIKSGGLAPIPGVTAPPGFGAGPPLPPRGTPVRLALLVPAFPMQGVSGEQAHLVTGFRHELIACLTRFREWVVVDGPGLPPVVAETARVGTRMALEASPMELGGRVSLSLTLRDEASRMLVWSERFELTLDGWFDIRRNVVSRIAVSLLGSISAARLAETAGTPDVSLAAHDKWLRGQAIINLFQPDNWKRAETLFTEAITEAPGYSPPYSSLVQMDNAEHIANPGLRRSRATELRAIGRAEQAVALDGMDSRAQLCLGWALAMAKRYERAANHIHQAVRLNPQDPWTLVSGALFQAFTGEHDAARALADEAMSMSLVPVPAHWVYHSAIAYLRGDDAFAAEAAQRTQTAALPSRAWHAAALFNLGRVEEAGEVARDFLHAARAQWNAAEEPSDGAIGQWFLHLFPIAREAEWNRLRDGVAGAGIPVAASRHHGW